jgi:hypothetical protein
VYRGQGVGVVVVEEEEELEEEMVLQLRRMMAHQVVHFAGRDCYLAVFLN